MDNEAWNRLEVNDKNQQFYEPRKSHLAIGAPVSLLFN